MTASERRVAHAATRPARAPERAPTPLKIVITSPFVWPWVRRGSERIVHDLSRFLHGRGHRVTVFASGPDDRIEGRDGIDYHLLRQRFGTRYRQFNCCHNFGFRLQRELVGCDADVVFSMNYFDAFGAIKARQASGARYKVIFHSAGILSRKYFRAVPLDAWFFRTVHAQADLTVAVSRFAGEVFERDFGTAATVLYPPVQVEEFVGANMEGLTGSAPRILMAGDVDETRKGARALCRALPLIRERYPDARLVFAGRASDRTQQALRADVAASVPADAIDFLGVGRVEHLPDLYRGAAVTVLPAIEEAFGMVLAESLTAGTPVVGARHGGIPEIIDNELLGRLFEPAPYAEQTDNVRGLADAIIAVLDGGKTAAVVAACRNRGRGFSWDVLGPEYERVLLQLTHRPEASDQRSAHDG